mmetsp:Transcript_15719/g.31871  ORF Transcript_15719/g.31871 Transcript_15719/m.31871 type:complete len:85 (+) Transcript_15719:266-520(+)
MPSALKNCSRSPAGRQSRRDFKKKEEKSLSFQVTQKSPRFFPASCFEQVPMQKSKIRIQNQDLKTFGFIRSFIQMHIHSSVHSH